MLERTVVLNNIVLSTVDRRVKRIQFFTINSKVFLLTDRFTRIVGLADLYLGFFVSLSPVLFFTHGSRS